MVKLHPHVFEELGKRLAPPTPPPPPRKKKRADEGWSPLLTPKQQEAFDSPARYVLCDGEKGSGKCVSPESQVYVGDGLKRIRRIADETARKNGLNDLIQPVIAWNGKAPAGGLAAHVWIEQSRDAKRAELAHGGELTGSPRHPLWTCRDDGVFGWISLEDMQAGIAAGRQFWTPLFAHPSFSKTALQSVALMLPPKKCKICGELAVARGLCHSHYQNLVCYRKEQHDLREPVHVTLTKDLAYALGALCGDGSLNIATGDNRSIGFANIDSECIRGVRDAVEYLGAKLTHVSGPNHIITGSPAIRALIVALGMACKADAKRIPDQIIESPASVLAAFLCGLFDADGTVDKSGSVSLTTISRELANDVQRSLQALGVFSVIRPKKGVGAWNVSVMGKWARAFKEAVGFRIARKQARIREAVKSARCPSGENHNRYGLPNPICDLLRKEWTALLEREPKSRAWHNANRKFASVFKGCVPSRKKVQEMLETCGRQQAADDYLVSETWVQVQAVTDCESELIDLSVPLHESFLANGLVNHNTIGLLHKLVRHCYENENALALILVRVKSMATKGGAWDKLNNHILPRWKDGNIEPPFIEKNGKTVPNPRAGQAVDEGLGIEFSDVMHDSQHNEYIWIENRHGGWSMVVLVSAPHANQLRDRMRGYEPSFALVDELTSCDSIEYLRAVAIQIGRREGIEGPQQYCAACNPEGPSHWVHKVWFEEAFDPVTGQWDHDYHRIHVPIEDNRLNLPAGYLENLQKLYRNDPVEAARMLNGEWVDRPSGDALFKDVFISTLHVHPPLPTTDRILPNPNYPILVGMDPGSANNAFIFMQWLPYRNRMTWVIFDEMVYVQRRIPYPILVPALLRRLKFWNDVSFGPLIEPTQAEGMKALFDLLEHRPTPKRRFRVVYVADNSAFNQYRAAGGSYDVLDFEKIANDPKNGAPPLHQQLGLERMKVVSAPKFSGSVRIRTRLVMDELGAEQLLVSAGCPKIIEMFGKLESEPQKPNQPFDADLSMTPKRSAHLHPFDAMCNPILTASINPKLLVPPPDSAQEMFRIGS